MLNIVSTRVGLLTASSLLILLAGACDQSKGSAEDDGPSKTTETAKPKATAAETATPTAQASETAGAAATHAPSGSAKMTIPGRTTVPTTEEWDAVGEITVKGSSALNCETKMVREWLRVSCRGKNDSGGTPTSLRVTKGGKPGTFTYAYGGVTSLVTPYVDGVHIEAVFSWTDKSHPLVVDWPHGAPLPTIVGVFEGAKSPLDRVTTGDPTSKAYACKCAKEFFRQGSDITKDMDCSDVAVNEDCYYTYPNSCTSYSKCAIGEPGVMPECRPGHVRVWINVCAKGCASNSDCPSGTSCKSSEAIGGAMACQQ